MKTLIIAASTGAVAGLIDVLPMVRKKRPKFSIIAIFIQWVYIGLAVAFLNWDLQPWLKGLIISELGMLPFLVIAFFKNKKSIVPTIIFAGLLGACIGAIGAILM